MAGYWFAGFDDGVRYVLVDGAEVSQGEYVRALITHLAAPMLCAVALLVVGTAFVNGSRTGSRG